MMNDSRGAPARDPQQPVGSGTARPARSGIRTTLGIIGGLFAAATIGVASFGSISSATAGQDARTSLTVIAPAAAGGGWDGVAREIQKAQRANGIVNNVQVVNVPGAGGTIGLSSLATLAGQGNTIMVGGIGQLAATIQYGSAVTLDDVTPLALLVEEYDVIVVPADSPYETLDELVEAWRADPRSIPWTGGGSFDQLVVTELALAAGIDPVDTTYISSDGGGEAIQALLNGTAKAATGGYPDNIDQIESGRLRALAIATPERIEGISIPTAKEQGYDVSLANWRMLAAPPGLSDENVEALREVVLETLDTPEWRDAIDRYRWTEQVLTGDELDRFLDTEKERVARLYEEMGV